MASWSPTGPEPAIRSSARAVLGAQWREPGFTCPNATTYPWLWLWDSCFHAIVHAELDDDERAATELATALSGQDVTGFVPHLLYLDGSTVHEGFWGRAGTSSITQPPIYGLAVAELVRRGVRVSDEVMARATDGLRFLFERRRRSPAGLIEIVHPWESGCDHSPRWDDWIAPGTSPHAPGHLAGLERIDPYDQALWFRRKGELLRDVHRSNEGAPLWNDEFACGSVAFSAISVFCVYELAAVSGDRSVVAQADEVREALTDRWDPGLRTWIDDGPTAHGSGRIRTAEALLPLLVESRSDVIDAVVAELEDPDGFAGEFGLTQVHRDEPRFRPGSYWRGPSWPQLDYLLWLGLVRAGRAEAARILAESTVRGALESDWSEYWDADTGRGGGAAPQSWTTLAICMH